MAPTGQVVTVDVTISVTEVVSVITGEDDMAAEDEQDVVGVEVGPIGMVLGQLLTMEGMTEGHGAQRPMR